MSLHTISSLERITPRQLHTLLSQSRQSPPPPVPAPTSSTMQGPHPSSYNTLPSSSTSTTSSIAIIDVRDSDYIGGHILGSQNIPSNTLDYRTPSLARELADKDLVVFHCMLSQQRGPKAALRYLRERERLLGVEGKRAMEEKEEGNGKGTGQKVVVLKGGFSAWQAEYGEDETVTEGYRRELWED